MKLSTLWRKHGALVLAVGAGAGLISSVILAVRATFNVTVIHQEMADEIEKVREEIEEKKANFKNEAVKTKLDEEFNEKARNIKVRWGLYAVKEFIPVLLTAGGGLSCIIFSQKMNAKTIAALSAGYAAMATKSRIIEDKIRQYIGEYKEDEFDEDVAQDWIDRSPVTPNGAVIETGKGNELFFDSFSGRYFLSSKDFVAGAIKDAEEDVSRGRGRGASRLGLGGYGFVLNDWYHNYLGIPTVELGGYFRFPNDSFHVDLVRTPCKEKSVAPYCWALIYKTVDTI